jgi:UrcA family protein
LKSFAGSSRPLHAPQTAGSHRCSTPQATPVEAARTETNAPEEITMNTLTTTTTFRSLLIAASMAGALMAATPASAADVATRVVPVGDLNLATTAGFERLNDRLHKAAAQVCGETSRQTLSRNAAIEACQNGAIGDAIAQLGNPSFAAWYVAKTGRGVPTRVASAK